MFWKLFDFFSMKSEEKRTAPLAGRLVGISVSDSADLQALGLDDGSLRDVLSALVSKLVAQGARIGYGGDLREGGFTYELFYKIAAQRDVRPETFVHYLAYPVWQNVGAQGLFDHVKALRTIGLVRVFLPDGRYSTLVGDDQGIVIQDGPLSGLTADMIADASELEPLWSKPGRLAQDLLDALSFETSIPDSLSRMRVTMAQEESARVIVGGQVDGYMGNAPGIAEEALETIKAGKVLIPVASYGGCARFVAHYLSVIPADKLLPQKGFGTNFDACMRDIHGLSDDFEGSLSLGQMGEIRGMVDERDPGRIADGVLGVLGD